MPWLWLGHLFFWSGDWGGSRGWNGREDWNWFGLVLWWFGAMGVMWTPVDFEMQALPVEGIYHA